MSSATARPELRLTETVDRGITFAGVRGDHSYHAKPLRKTPLFLEHLAVWHGKWASLAKQGAIMAHMDRRKT